MNYPVWDIPASGLLIAVIAILHVFVSHFAVGGGLFLVLVERKARRDGDDAAARLREAAQPLLHPADARLRRHHRRRHLVHHRPRAPGRPPRRSSTRSSGAGRSSGRSSSPRSRRRWSTTTAGIACRRARTWPSGWIYFVVGVAEPGRHQRHPHLHADAGRVDRDARVLGRLLQRDVLAGAVRAHVRRRRPGRPVRDLDRRVASGRRAEGPRRARLSAWWVLPMAVAVPLTLVWYLAAAVGGGRAGGRDLRRGRDGGLVAPAHGRLRHGHDHRLSRRPARRVLGDGRGRRADGR